MIVTPYCFKQKTKTAITASSTVLELQDEDAQNELCLMLGTEGCTRLILSNCVHHEIVGITCVCGELVMERGMENTDRLTLPACSVVKFELTPGLNLKIQQELLEQAAEDSTDDTKVNNLSSPTLQISADEDDPTCTIIDLPECDEVEWCTPGWTFTYKDGCITKEPDPTTAIKDGVVTNATLCHKDNKLIRVEQGDSVNYQNNCTTCGGCGCTACTDTTDTDDPTVVP